MRSKDLLLAVGLTLFALLLLAATNPRPDQFEVWMEIQELRAERAGAEAPRTPGSAEAGPFGSLESGGSAKPVDSGFRRSDCLLFSVYSSRRSDGSLDRSYLGVARSFIRLR